MVKPYYIKGVQSQTKKNNKKKTKNKTKQKHLFANVLQNSCS